MFEFFKKIFQFKNTTESFKETIENESENKKRYQQYKSLINSKPEQERILIVRDLKNIIVEHLNLSEAIQSIEHEYGTQDNSKLEEIYRWIEHLLDEEHNIYTFEYIHPNDKKYYENSKFLDNQPIRIGINELSILLNPWNGKRIINNLIEIGGKNVFDGIRHSHNIANHYLYPMDIVVCNGGNHSQFSARYKNQGDTIIKEIHDYSNLYSKIEFDGENYICKVNQEVIRLNKDYPKELIFYSGIIFELGRYILSNKCPSLDVAKNYFADSI